MTILGGSTECSLVIKSNENTDDKNLLNLGGCAFKTTCPLYL